MESLPATTINRAETEIPQLDSKGGRPRRRDSSRTLLCGHFPGGFYGMIVPPRLTADRAQARAAAPPGKSELNLRFYSSILTYVRVCTTTKLLYMYANPSQSCVPSGWRPVHRAEGTEAQALPSFRRSCSLPTQIPPSGASQHLLPRGHAV